MAPSVQEAASGNPSGWTVHEKPLVVSPPTQTKPSRGSGPRRDKRHGLGKKENAMLGFLGLFGGRSSSYELDFPQFLKQYNLLLLPVATDDTVPGAVLDTGGFFSKGFTYQGHLSELMPRVPDEFWETELDRANLFTGTINHSFNLRGKSNLSLWGVNIGGGLARANSASFRIMGVSARSFANGKGHASILTLKPLLMRLKQVQPEAYEVLVNDYIVLETYYASECLIEFDVTRGADIQAEVLQAGGVTVGGQGSADWKSTNSIVVTKNVEVPFAFSGLRVPR
jgi:hypothetical protein